MGGADEHVPSTVFEPITPNNRIALPEARDAAAALGQKLLVLEANTADEIDAQFASLDRQPADAIVRDDQPVFCHSG
jgi:hypothetical protein